VQAGFFEGFINGFQWVIRNIWWIGPIIILLALLSVLQERKEKREQVEREERIAKSLESIAASRDKQKKSQIQG